MVGILIFIVIVAVLYVVARDLPRSDCTGNCRQGRLPCDCQINKK
jgi:hypothetical protein